MKSTPAAQTPAEHAMVFASLAEPALLEHLRTRAMVQDTVALSAAFDSGIFDIRGLIDAEPALVEEGPKHRVDKTKQAASYKRMAEITGDWAPRISAVTAFLRNGTKETLLADPVLGAMKNEMTTLVMGATQEFKSLFEKVALDCVDQMHWVLGSGKSNPAARVDPLDESFALLTAGAVVLNLPHVAAKIINMVPEASVTCFPSSLLGPEFEDLLVQGRDCQMSAAGVALQFSRIQCLEAMKVASAPGGTMPPDILVGQSKHPSEGVADYKPFTFSENMDSARFVFVSNPSTFRWAVEDALSSRKVSTVNFVQRAGMDALDRDSVLRPYTPAFLAAGIYDLNPAEAVKYAALNGLEDVVREAGNPPRMGNGRPEAGRRVQKVDWVGMSQSHPRNEGILYNTIKAIARQGEGTRESALALVRRAEADGAMEPVMGAFLADSDQSKLKVRAEPMHYAILAKDPQIVVAMLNAGVSPTEPQFPGVLSPLAMAEALDVPEVAHAIRAWSLRESARRAMDSMDDKPKVAP